MANYEILDDPEFQEGIRKFEPTDKASAEVFNAVIQALVNNSIYLRNAIDEQNTNLGNRAIVTDIVSARSIKMLFAGRFASLVTIQGTSTAMHASYIVQGYRETNARFHVTRLHGGDGISHAISNVEQAVTFALATPGVFCSVFMLQGSLPKIS